MARPEGQRRALILGAAGQDGSYLAELLDAHGYAVTGLVRRALDADIPNLAAVRDRIELVRGDIADADLLRELVASVRPHEIYNVASTSTLAAAWEDPLRCARDTGLPAAVLLEAILAVDPSIRLVQASSSQVFGAPAESPQSERTPPAPADPYAAAKLYADSMVAVHRARHGLHASSAILFNHESPRRPPAYVSRKVTRAVAAMARGATEPLVLGDLDAVRDWSYAGDVAQAMYLMARADEPGDLVLASGRGRTVGELVAVAFAAAELDPDGRVEVDEALVRRDRGLPVIGDATLARERLGWAASTSFEDMIGAMVAHDLAVLDAQGAAGLRSRR
jgi:GDPmannose 4,6-dehydratase